MKRFLLLGIGLTLVILTPRVNLAASQKAIPLPNYAHVLVTWRSTAFPLLEETLEIRENGENLCDQAIVEFLKVKRNRKASYSFHQTLQSPTLQTIGQFVNGRIFISKFVYSCNGVYLRED